MNREEANLLVDKVNNISKTSPLLLVGEAYLTFKKFYDGKIVEITKENIKEIVEYYSITTLNYPLVLEDISTLSSIQVNYLLKLIEESKTPIILLSSYDNIKSILLSRVKTYLRFKEEVSSELKNDIESIESIKERVDTNTSYKDKVLLMRDISPQYYLLDLEFSSMKNKDKYINILL